MRKNAVLITGILILLLFAGGLLVWEKTPLIDTTPPASPTPPVTPPTTMPPTSQIPEDWKKYRNEKMKFEIQYPPDWKMDAAEGDVVIYSGEKIKIEPGSPVDPYGQTSNLIIHESGKDCGSCSTFSPRDLKSKIVNGYYVLQAFQNNIPYSGFWFYSSAKDHVLYINYQPMSNQLKKMGTDQIFQTMFSTFRFLD